MKRNLFKFSEFQAEYPLSQELPYWDFLESPQEECIVLADGTLVQSLKLTGADIETWDTDQINRFTSQLRSVLNSLSDSLEVQFLANLNSDYADLILQHEAQKGKRPLVNWITEHRICELKNEMERQELRRLHLYAFVYLRVHSIQGGIHSFFSKPTHFARVRKEEHEKRVRELKQLTGSFVANLGSMGVQTSALSTKDTRSLIYAVLNPLRGSKLSSPKPSHEHRIQEFTQEELKLLPELSLSTAREQLVFSDVIQGVDSFFLDGHYHRVITLKTLPEMTHSALISRLTSLSFPFCLSIQVRVPEQSRELSSLQTKRRMAHSMTVNRGGRATDLESEAKLQSTEELLRELINTGQKIFYFQLAVLLKTTNQDDLERQTKAVLSRFREMNGAEGLSETVAGFKVFKTLLPAGNLISVRPKRVKTDNLADFIPVYQPWDGDNPPVCVFRNRMGGLTSYDPFDPKLPNYNALVTGSSGSGKSFLNNCILLQYMTQDPLIYVIDIGGSYRKLCEFMEGQYVEILPSTDGVSHQAMNPFLLPKGSTTPSPQKIKFLLALLETMLTDEDGDKLRKLDRSLLEQAVLETYTRCIPKIMPKLSDLVKTLEESTGDHGQALRDFARMLYPWTGSRPYGRLLDIESRFDLNSEMVVFDLKGLSSYPDLQSVMVLIITDFILGKVETTPNQRKRILMDECWALLQSQGASQFMEYCARTLRKTGSGITFITQGLEEIERSLIGPAILNNTASKFILMQRGDLEPTRRILKLNDQEMALISSLKQEKGSYSEAFLIANEKRSIVQVIPTSVEYWLSTSDAADHALLAQARERFTDLDLPGVIYWLAQHFPRGSLGISHIPDELLNQKAG